MATVDTWRTRVMHLQNKIKTEIRQCPHSRTKPIFLIHTTEASGFWARNKQTFQWRHRVSTPTGTVVVVHATSRRHH